MKPELTSAQTVVLVAVVLLYEAQGRVTVAQVASLSGRNLSTTHTHLITLRRLDFVRWEDHRAGTLRPTVERVPFGEAA